MCPYAYYDVMRKSKDPRWLRYQMVLSVEKRGIKQMARDFHVSRTTVRKWYRRYRDHGYHRLESRSVTECKIQATLAVCPLAFTLSVCWT